jgi:SRSO17 transposase
MDQKQLARVRRRLERFAVEVLEPIPRRDSRAWGVEYLRGVMLDGRRKSIQPMAERLGVDHQGLSQFVNQSPWEYGEVRARLARRVVAGLDPSVLIVDDSGFPKQGRMSPGVAHQYCGALGKQAVCQVGVSLTLANEKLGCPVNWRLFLPEEWNEDAERRKRCHIPDEIHHRPKWQLALDAIDELGEWGVDIAALPVLGDAGYGEITAFRLGLEQRDLSYIVEVKSSTSAHARDAALAMPTRGKRGPAPTVPKYSAPMSLKSIAAALPKRSWKSVTWRDGSKGELRSRFAAVPVRPANKNIPRDETTGELPLRLLVVQWPDDADAPSKYWLSNMPIDTPIVDLARLGKARWRIEQDYRELKDALGIDHFEGRSFNGWHRHVTLVSAAHVFITLERQDPKAPAPISASFKS